MRIVIGTQNQCHQIPERFFYLIFIIKPLWVSLIAILEHINLRERVIPWLK